MKYVGYYNGEIGPLEEMKIPMLDRAVYFGDGCYDATTFANNNIFAADDHLDRFYNSCKLLEIPFEMSREELRAELQKCIDANEIDHGMLYWQCSRGTTYRGHQFPPASVKPNLMIFTVPCDLIPFDKTFRLISMEDTRFLHHQDAEPDSKCHRLPALHRTGLPGNGLPPRRTRHRMRPQQYLNHQGRCSLHPTER